MKLVLIIIFYLSCGFALAQEKIMSNNPNFKPSVIWAAPEDHFYLIAEKELGYLHLYEGHTYLYSYPMTSGLSRGKKSKEGDKKTPVGVYFLENYYSTQQLMKKYKTYEIFGSGALTLNYPNPIDRKHNKKGSNIWIHGTNQPERLKVKNSSQGCLVLSNEHFEQVASLIKENKVILVITDYLSFKQVPNTKPSNLFIEAHGQKLVWTKDNRKEYQVVK